MHYVKVYLIFMAVFFFMYLWETASCVRAVEEQGTEVPFFVIRNIILRDFTHALFWPVIATGLYLVWALMSGQKIYKRLTKKS